VKRNCRGRPRLRNAKVRAPLWQLTAIARLLRLSGNKFCAGSWNTGLKVATNGFSGLTRPSELGPQTIMPKQSMTSRKALSRSCAASPRSSAKPELITTAARTPLRPHSSSVGAT